MGERIKSAQDYIDEVRKKAVRGDAMKINYYFHPLSKPHILEELGIRKIEEFERVLIDIAIFNLAMKKIPFYKKINSPVNHPVDIYLKEQENNERNFIINKNKSKYLIIFKNISLKKKNNNHYIIYYKNYKIGNIKLQKNKRHLIWERDVSS